MKTFIDQCKQKCEKATPGPWKLKEHGPECRIDSAADIPENERLILSDDLYLISEDAAFIAFARAALPEAVRRLQVAKETLLVLRSFALGREEKSELNEIIKELEAPLEGEK